VFRFTKDKKCIIYTILFILSIIPFFLNSPLKKSQPDKKELFSPELERINSVDKAVNYIDSLYATKGFSSFDTLEYVKTVTHFTKRRFYYGLSHYTVAENWIARLLGLTTWEHLSVIVDPDDILKRSEGLCSQQSIVFMELLNRKNISVRSVGLGYKEGPGHFLSEVNYKGSWHLYDVTMEPTWKKVVNHHKSMSYYLQNKDSLFMVYQEKYDSVLFNKLLDRVQYGVPNEFPAKNMLLFQKTTRLITYVLPCFLLLILVFFALKLKNKQNS
jgi:hypothetical protein